MAKITGYSGTQLKCDLMAVSSPEEFLEWKKKYRGRDGRLYDDDMKQKMQEIVDMISREPMDITNCHMDVRRRVREDRGITGKPRVMDIRNIKRAQMITEEIKKEFMGIQSPDEFEAFQRKYPGISMEQYDMEMMRKLSEIICMLPGSCQEISGIHVDYFPRKK